MKGKAVNGKALSAKREGDRSQEAERVEESEGSFPENVGDSEVPSSRSSETRFLTVHAFTIAHWCHWKIVDDWGTRQQDRTSAMAGYTLRLLTPSENRAGLTLNPCVHGSCDAVKVRRGRVGVDLSSWSTGPRFYTNFIQKAAAPCLDIFPSYPSPISTLFLHFPLYHVTRSACALVAKLPCQSSLYLSARWSCRTHLSLSLRH